MKRPTSLALLLALATWLAPNVARAEMMGIAGLQDRVTTHGIERERDIPLP
jgi:hypothetical protein